MSLIETRDFDNDNERCEPVSMVLHFTAKTIRWLTEIAAGDDKKAAAFVSKCMESIREDDQAAHRKLN